MAITIINKGSGVHNNHSEADGIGAHVSTLPYHTGMLLMSVPEFDWVFEDDTGKGICEFVKLNPQYDSRFFKQFDKMPDTVINKDGAVYSLSQRRFIKFSKTKGVTAI